MTVPYTAPFRKLAAQFQYERDAATKPREWDWIINECVSVQRQIDLRYQPWFSDAP